MSSVRKFLPQCEYAKQRKNLLRVCGMVLKSVVDKHCFEGVLTDSDPDVANLLVILENILMHRCRNQGPKWFSDDLPTYWPCILSACSKVKRSCIPSILSMGSNISGLALGRIFLQMALMERRLSEYLSELFLPEQRNVLRSVYEADAFMAKDEGAALPHICLGLNAIDFSFCPKGDDLNYQYVPCIDFTPYLDFNPCSQALLDDEHEQAVLNGSVERNEVATVDGRSDVDGEDWKAKFQMLYLKYRDLDHQRNYAEEMLSLKQSRIERLETDLALQRSEVESLKSIHQHETNQLQKIVVELQSELASLGREKTMTDRRRLELFLTGLPTNGKFHEAIALKDLVAAAEPNHRSISFTTVDGVSLNDGFERSPYGSIREGVDALERLMRADAGSATFVLDDHESLRPHAGSIDDSN